MVRSNAASSVLLFLVLFINCIFSLAKAAVPKTILEFQQMVGNYVEHRVDEEEAKLVARTLQPELSDGRPGCEVCTTEEIEYCTGSAAIEDHCCCDLRHLESFPYVPHTCYLRPGCSPNAGNCARYARLRVCCCDYFTAKKWKSQASLPTLPWRTFLLCYVCALSFLQ